MVRTTLYSVMNNATWKYCAAVLIWMVRNVLGCNTVLGTEQLIMDTIVSDINWIFSLRWLNKIWTSWYFTMERLTIGHQSPIMKTWKRSFLMERYIFVKGSLNTHLCWNLQRRSLKWLHLGYETWLYRAVTRNTCYDWLCLIDPWCYGWTGL